MGDRLHDKVAIITGGASGMGRATALRFLDEGARVVIGDLNAATAEDVLTAAEALGHGEKISFVRCDVSDEAAMAELVEHAVGRHGRLDCMFNNAGVGGAFGPITETEVAEWDFTMAALARSVFLGMKHAGRVMKRQPDGGSIISTASIAGITGGGGPHAYSAAKAAVINLTRSVSMELARHRIRVNAIAPGIIETPLLHEGDRKKIEERMLPKQPWPALGQPEDIARVALFLASDDSAFITGETIVVDGGTLAQGPNLWGRTPDSPLLKVAGVNRGSTGEESTIRPLSEEG